ncbi:MAG: two-component sensor histidine kinase [Lachnospiraceae bacterium]|nr:two-component sensor histidine kinase [Lachnospiraceae bacterium]
MKRKINIQLISIVVISIVLTMVLILFVYYGIFKKQVFNELTTVAGILAVAENEDLSGKAADKNSVTYRMIENLSEKDLRVTVIDANGTVCFDNGASDSEIQADRDRPEMQEAYEQGEGFAVRESATIAQSSFYYAVRLDDGGVLRVSKEAQSLLNVFISSLPTLLAVGASLIILCMIVASFLTKSLVRPIEDMAQNLDNTEQVAAYSELAPIAETIRRQHEDIMKGARMRQDFTANVSHELKTPLTVISGYSELMENGMATPEDVTRFSHEIHKNATRLLTLINDILRLSELDTGNSGPDFEKINLYESARVCVSMLSLNAEKHDVSLSIEGNPCYVYAGKQMIEELLYNLTDNAIRYNEPGGTVVVEVKEEGDKVVLTVKDTGIGIPKEHCNRIFERFYRVDKSRSKQTGGTGLGLAIVKHVVEQIGATISLQSEVGQGTEIQVEFPMRSE